MSNDMIGELEKRIRETAVERFLAYVTNALTREYDAIVREFGELDNSVVLSPGEIAHALLETNRGVIETRAVHATADKLTGRECAPVALWKVATTCMDDDEDEVPRVKRAKVRF